MVRKEQALEIAMRGKGQVELIDSFETPKYWAFVFAPEGHKQGVGIGTNPIFVDKKHGELAVLPMDEVLEVLKNRST